MASRNRRRPDYSTNAVMDALTAPDADDRRAVHDKELDNEDVGPLMDALTYPSDNPENPEALEEEG